MADDLAVLRDHAVGVAYRMLGSRTEAEDVAQDTMVRVQAALEGGDVRSPIAFTTTIATRLAIDHLRSARVRREQYVGPWLPEPVSAIGRDDPAAAAELGDSLSFAMLVVLESLGPEERAAFLLHDTFGYGYGELATILDRTPAACRKLVSRARQRVADGRPRITTDEQEHGVLLERFVAAARSGDVSGLVQVLAPDAEFVSDGGANLKSARHPIVGRDRVSRFVGYVGPKLLADVEIEFTEIQGEPCFVVWADDRPSLFGTVGIEDGLVRTVHMVRNPEKLRWVLRDE